MTTSHFSLGGTDSRIDRVVNSTLEQLDGRMLTIEGQLAYWKVFLTVRGFLGELSSGSSDLAVDLAVAEATLGLQVIPWVGVTFGVEARSWDTGSADETRWYYKAGLRGEAALIGPVLYGYLDYSYSFAADWGYNWFQNGQGFEGGVRLRAPSVPMTLRIAYRLDHTEFIGVITEETVQHLVFAIGYEFGNLKRQ